MLFQWLPQYICLVVWSHACCPAVLCSSCVLAARVENTATSGPHSATLTRLPILCSASFEFDFFFSAYAPGTSNTPPASRPSSLTGCTLAAESSGAFRRATHTNRPTKI